ncbi:MAG: type II toxin-antitoxin system prevent-host-death family antitoxin [Desulfobacteraceae bacterium]
MQEINIKEARSRFTAILESATKGEDIIITRRGKPIARLTRINENSMPLGSLKEFRTRIDVKGIPLSDTVVRLREEERY